MKLPEMKSYKDLKFEFSPCVPERFNSFIILFSTKRRKNISLLKNVNPSTLIYLIFTEILHVTYWDHSLGLHVSRVLTFLTLLPCDFLLGSSVVETLWPLWTNYALFISGLWL